MTQNKSLIFLGICLLGLSTVPVRAVIAYSQPHDGSATLRQSSWWEPDGYDADIFAWDDFVLATNKAITEIRWRGGFIYGGSYGGPVLNFEVAIYPSIAAGTEPDVVHPPLVSYMTGGNAGQTPAGTFGGTAMYDYHFTLPSPFQAAGSTRYWVYIVAWQHGVPEWGFANGSGGNGSYFRKLSDYMYQRVPGDFAMTLMTSDAPTYTISATASPTNAGTIQGAGAYPSGSLVTLQAMANTGFGFLNWTENGAQVSGSATYSFTANHDRTLIANFVPAYSITTSCFPLNSGLAAGDGVYNSGDPVVVTATANPGFVFTDWSEFGTTVSTNLSYSFAAGADRTLVANFVLNQQAVLFDFDNAPPHTSLPIDLTVSGLTAHLSATGSGFSIQRADTMGFTPLGFAGYCIYPNSVFAADLVVAFSARLTDFSIMYAPQELGCDDSARMRVTAYLDGALAGTSTAIAPVPGTWPTGTLSIHVAGGFNSVVVHYDARPPTCQDWGPIFLADNMLVTRSCGFATGDLNCDGTANNFDIDPFVLALVDPAGYAATYPTCDACAGDINHDGVLNNFDIDPFVTCLTGGCP